MAAIGQVTPPRQIHVVFMAMGVGWAGLSTTPVATALAPLATQALFPVPLVLVIGGVLMGLSIGNVTTLAPIIVRREFGMASFGALASRSCWRRQSISWQRR